MTTTTAEKPPKSLLKQAGMVLVPSKSQESFTYLTLFGITTQECRLLQVVRRVLWKSASCTRSMSLKLDFKYKVNPYLVCLTMEPTIEVSLIASGKCTNRRDYFPTGREFFPLCWLRHLKGLASSLFLSSLRSSSYSVNQSQRHW